MENRPLSQIDFLKGLEHLLRTNPDLLSPEQRTRLMNQVKQAIYIQLRDLKALSNADLKLIEDIDRKHKKEARLTNKTKAWIISAVGTVSLIGLVELAIKYEAVFKVITTTIVGLMLFGVVWIVKSALMEVVFKGDE
jgi:hypothetical protein